MKKEMQDAIAIMEGIMDFGIIPRYSVLAGKKYIYVCLNNGVFHTGPREKTIPGDATFIGKFTSDEIVSSFSKRLGVARKQ